MEAVFNYLGNVKNLERNDATFQLVDDKSSLHAASDIDKSAHRFALMEITAAVADGCLKISFSYNQHMRHQSSISSWLATCKKMLQQGQNCLSHQDPENTLSDFSLLPLTYHGLGGLSQKLPEYGLQSLEQIEDIYPCSPMQRGIYLSQIKDPHKYAYSCIFEARLPHGKQPVDLDRVEEAWKAVVQRHAVLRTLLIDSVDQKGLADQLVIREAKCQVQKFACEDGQAQATLGKLAKVEYQKGQLQHRLSLCKTSSGQVFCQLDLSHVISDGSSMPILLRDLAYAYGGTLELHKQKPLFSNYIAHLQSVSSSQGIDYWKDYLEDVRPCHFPALVDGVEARQKRHETYTLSMPNRRKLQDFCDSSGVTLATLLQLVWALVIRCYSGADEVCFGFLTSGRDVPVENIEDVVGPFINMLICRLTLDASLQLSEALDNVQLNFMNSLVHQTCSLGEVQHALNLGDTSLFNTVFNYQDRTARQESSSPALCYEFLEAQDPSEYSISVGVEAQETSIDIHFGYWTDRMCLAQAQNVAMTFEQVTLSLIEQEVGEGAIMDLNFCSEHSRTQLKAWNCKPAVRTDECVHTTLENQTLLHASSPKLAICGWDGSFTYAQLQTQVTRLANYLIGQGIGRGSYVPLCFEKSVWAIVAQLGILKAGGAFVPLDPYVPEDRSKEVVNMINAPLVLCSASQHRMASRLDVRPFILDQNSIERLSDLPITPNSIDVTPSDPACVMFTSGTTATSKAVVMQHASICTTAKEQRDRLFLSSDSCVLQYSSFTSDVSVLEILVTLIHGGCVCVPKEEEKVYSLSKTIQDFNVNWTYLTPTIANTLRPTDVPSLRVMVVGGEDLPLGHIEKWSGKVAVVNCYGSTECTSSAVTDTKSDPQGRVLNIDPATIGRASAGRAWLVDPYNHDHLMPIGAVGELVIEGHAVARGYLDPKEEVAKAFDNSPAWAKDQDLMGIQDIQGRIYATGDLVRYNSDGSIRFLSRKDQQAMSEDRRLELNKIEYHCNQHLPGGAQLAVEAIRPSKASDRQAFAVFFSSLDRGAGAGRLQHRNAFKSEILPPPEDSIRTMASKMKSAVQDFLPAHMVPEYFFPVSILPCLGSAKIDRIEMHEIVRGLSDESLASYEIASAPTKVDNGTDVEQQLKRLWEKILELAPASVSSDDHFFRLGGDSYTAIELAGAARAQQIDLTVRDIFKTPKLCDMARSCDPVSEQDQTTKYKPLSLVHSFGSADFVREDAASQCRVNLSTIEDIYPASPIQESLVTLTIKQSGAYVAQLVFALSVDVEIDRFKWAWQKTVDDLDVLRSRFIPTASSKFLQVVLKEHRIVWQDEDHLHKVADQTKQVPPYVGGPLAQYSIVHDRDTRRQYFVLSIHHALYDGWSLPLVLRHAETAYLHQNTKPPAIAYSAFVEYLATRDSQTTEKWWKTHLAGASSLNFPEVAHFGQNEQGQTQTTSRRVGFARQGMGPDVTAATIMRAAWATVLAAYTRSDDVVFGETLNGRDISVPSIGELPGPTLTTVPTRIMIDRRSTMVKFLLDVQKLTAEMIPHEHFGLQRIRRLDQDSSMACDFQNLLVIQAEVKSSEDELWEIQEGGSVDNFFTYPLVVECKMGDELEFVAHHKENVLSVWQVERLLGQFEAAVTQFNAALTDATSILMSEMNAFSESDHQLVQHWNSRPRQCVDNTVHNFFEQIMMKYPSNLAVAAWDDDLTYRELYDYASRLALYLNAHGVGPNIIVPLCMDKSAWTMVTVMAVLMAGGGFASLDPSHPTSRHQEILEDLDATTIICSPVHRSRYTRLTRTQIVVDREMIYRLPSLTSPQQLPHRVNGDSAAYVIFTSGSTGRPKGVVIEHRAICSSSVAFGKLLLMDSTSRVFQFASLAFDASIMETLTALMFGACICIPTDEERLGDLGGAMHRMGVTWSFMTPSLARLLEPSSVPSLKTLACGGEAMVPETAAKWSEHVELFNVYGPTETSVICTGNRVSSPAGDSACIGPGIASTGTWIVDPTDHNKLSPVGAVGELVLDGPTLARHYLKDEKKTNGAFVNRPTWMSHFNRGPNRLYKTGDLVRYNSHGSLVFFGRKDNQVKLNGQRVELGEIESRLDDDAHVRGSLVMVHQLSPRKKRLTAVMCLESLSSSKVSITNAPCTLVQDACSVEKAREELKLIKQRLSGLLPSYMVPQSWLIVENIPMQISGKLDRKRVIQWVKELDEQTLERAMNMAKDGKVKPLPALDSMEKQSPALDSTAKQLTAPDSIATQSTASEFMVTDTAVKKSTAPETPRNVERVLQDAWAHVLNLPTEDVDMNKSFLSLGKCRACLCSEIVHLVLADHSFQVVTVSQPWEWWLGAARRN